MKKALENDLLLYPCPVLLVTSKLGNVENVLTVSWTGIACSHPEYITIAIKPTRFSYSIIEKSGYFTANIINEKLLNVADYCGTFSGKSHNKFDICNLSITQGNLSNVPIINECPINIECKVEKIIELGSHNLFIGKVLDKLIDAKIDYGNIHKTLKPVAYFRPNYYSINESQPLGSFGHAFESKHISNVEQIY